MSRRESILITAVSLIATVAGGMTFAVAMKGKRKSKMSRQTHVGV